MSGETGVTVHVGIMEGGGKEGGKRGDKKGQLKAEM